MTSIRIAAFGRWTFIAGAAFGLVFSTLWRAFDWPEWLGALVAFAGGSAAYRLIEWAAARTAPTTRTSTEETDHA